MRGKVHERTKSIFNVPHLINFILYFTVMQANTQIIQIKNNQIVTLPINKIQDYAWGSTDDNCWVAKVSKQKQSRYAEFWMGTHPNGESKLTQTLTLRNYLDQIGSSQIQFLFKILSIQKCLSIQVHPNQQEAKQLNIKFPTLYLDDKDKPQMFLTLSDEFQLFIGFIEEKQLQQLLKIQPFKAVGQDGFKLEYKQRILFILEKLVSFDQNQVQQLIEMLLSNIGSFDAKRQVITKRLFEEFKYDVGILVSYLLQYHILPKGSCFGIQAGVPHAYIKGECFQLMKNSDNVVRLGLTPKKKDIPNLIKILRSNFQRGYSKVQPVQENSIKSYLWNSYEIKEVYLKEDAVSEVKINSNSIGIAINGENFFRSSCEPEVFQRIEQNSVFFLGKNSYEFKGKGKIYISTKY